MIQRHDDWTAHRKQAFLEALAQYGSVQKGAHAIRARRSNAKLDALRDRSLAATP